MKWMARFRATGSATPAKMGGYKPRTLRGEHAEWLTAPCREADFTISQLVDELAQTRGLKVDRRSVWEFLHAEGLSFKKKACSPRSRIGLTSRAAASNGASNRCGSTPPGWSSSMRSGPRTT